MVDGGGSASLAGRGVGSWAGSVVALLREWRNRGADKLLHCFTARRVGSISKGYP